MIDLAAASAYVRLFRGRIFVIKLGGACLARPALVAELARQIAVIDACGARPVIVHGAGPQVDELQRRLGEEPLKVAGRRVTTPAALDALYQAARESIGPMLARELERRDVRPRFVPAEEVVLAERRPPVDTEAGRVDFGLVGDIRRVDAEQVRSACEAGYVPILSPPVGDLSKRTRALNANADLLAAQIACALRAEKLLLLTSAGGVLADPAEPRSVLSTLTLAQLSELERKGAIQGGMKVKARAAKDALEGEVARVHVVSGIEPDALLGELFTTQGTGTLVTEEPESAPVEVRSFREARA